MSLLTESDLAGLCFRAFPDRRHQRIGAITTLPSRQHEMVAFRLRWSTPGGEMDEPLVVRRYVSTLSWWRAEDLGKAQREATITSWLYNQGFPVPAVYAREFGALGDVVLFSRIPGGDWSKNTSSDFAATVRPHVVRFAQLLAWLHSLAPPHEVLAVTPSITLPMALANLMALAVRIQLPELTHSVERVTAQAYRAQETERVLLHGDYHFSNVLLFEGRISGIVDWEYCALGDPRWDVATAYSQLVDFDAAGAADEFLSAYLHFSGREFHGAPLHLIVAPLQQWAIAEWLVKQAAAGRAPTFAMAQELIDLRDVHRRRAQMAVNGLEA